MARKVTLVLSCLAVAAAMGLSGCTWAETQREYPASMYRQADGPGHGHGHGHEHGAH